MPRKKIYHSHAERQQAYRQRINEKLANLQLIPVTQPRARKESRPQRLQRVIDELESLTSEYEDWLDSMPENLSKSELVSQLQETIEHLGEITEMLEALELPCGFGR